MEDDCTWTGRNYFDQLPDEVVIEIFAHVDVQSTASNVALVCKRLANNTLFVHD